MRQDSLYVIACSFASPARIEATEAAQTLNKSEVIAWFNSKKETLFSLNDEEKKNVVQELIEKWSSCPLRALTTTPSKFLAGF
ncbi:hypothetical protein NZD89_24295 [Alicyclobacillus fastidiosus]|uniref:Uncharacterized protein n=1 Tax=Alicyclobacillus fastidiosus TaxID=392011 RepID=A0ABY6ZER0_9BACL|nr:hypothetical protein [Alicyclobacillus fastidiosus]WAH41334.1 hypothetical protein NZD89_24295 [Alicyclobacillus fastidiosus]GMA62942.1 hypothetical protein GCM10025859_33820 [Alicyclobacillus fastidiosus]